MPYSAGGGSDIAVRVLQPVLEKELGTPVQVVNKVGAGSQVGITEAAKAKADGYTIGNANWPTIITVYQDPDRKSAFTRKDIQPVALHVMDPIGLGVKGDGKYKTLQDLIDAAKAKPGDVKVGTGGIMSVEHFAWLMIQKQTGAKFSVVHFDGAAPAMTALAGGHIDAVGGGFSTILPHVKSGNARFVATMAPEGKDMGVAGVQTMEDQGFKGFFGMTRGFFVPAGTPKETVEVLTGAFKKAMEAEEQKAKIKEIGQITKFLGPAEFNAAWDEQEKIVGPLIEMAKAESK